MVSDQEIANAVETLLRHSDPNTITTLNGVVQQLGLVLGFDLSHKTIFIRDQINHLFRSHPSKPSPSSQPQSQSQPHSSTNDRFNLQHQQQQQHYAQFHRNVFQQQQFPSHIAILQHQQLQQQQPEQEQERQLQQQQQERQLQQQQRQHQQQQQQQQQQRDSNFVSSVRQQHPSYPQVRQHVQSQAVFKKKGEGFIQNAQTVAVSTVMPKESAPTATKRRGGPGGLNKVCGCSPELQAIVGQPILSRTEIVKHLWAYIRKHNLQDPSNKRKIVCDEALRVLFETDITDMFKMNKLLSKHIIPLGPTKESSKAKRLKAEVTSTIESVEPVPAPASSAVIISEELSIFFGTGEREMLESDALGRVWQYIKVNLLEDPSNPSVILCDAKLQELLGRESISTLEISETLTRHHLLTRS